MRKWIVLTVVLSLVMGCKSTPSAPQKTDLELGLETIEASLLAKHTEVLASDEFEGRAPSSLGEEKTVAYLEAEFKKLGLAPGNGNAFTQDVPLVQMTADPSCVLEVQGPENSRSFEYGDDMIVWTKRVAETVNLAASDVVFVGYGIVAPEFGWNDYENLDVKGKTVVILVNDPGYATQDPALFTGNAMTYYGRWTYKYEEAARQGAEAALIVHDTGPAGYPWEVVSGSWSGAQFDLVSSDGNASRCGIEGWLSATAARALFELGGLDLNVLKKAAQEKGFKPVPLNAKASMTLNNAVKESVSRNVIATLPGTTRPDEYIVYMGHWDHLGKDESLEGDQIYNGAVDNATGTAALLVLAKAFMAMETKPERTLVFLAITAEEKGLLGSKYYAENPVYPTKQTVVAINMDGLNTLGKTKDVVMMGAGNSADLDQLVERHAATQNRVVKPDSNPEKGYFFRSDHINFAKKGVPAIYAASGVDHAEKGEAHGKAMSDDYVANRYHKPADNFDPNWDLSGAVEDLRMLFLIGHELSNGTQWPNWTEGNAFRAARDRDRAN